MAQEKKKTRQTFQKSGAAGANNAQRDKRPLLRYLGGFFLLLLCFYAIYTTPAFEQHLLQPLVNIQSEIASSFLNLFGMETTVEQSLLRGRDAVLNNAKGCDGIEATVLFLIGVLLMPFPWSSKLIGVAGGSLILFLLNIVRIAGLYLSRVYWPEGFDLLHIHGGFALFTIVSILLWAGWAGWALRREKSYAHANR
jgi:exosortase/archaeosortase family protein